MSVTWPWHVRDEEEGTTRWAASAWDPEASVVWEVHPRGYDAGHVPHLVVYAGKGLFRLGVEREVDPWSRVWSREGGREERCVTWTVSLGWVGVSLTRTWRRQVTP